MDGDIRSSLLMLNLKDDQLNDSWKAVEDNAFHNREVPGKLKIICELEFVVR